MEDQIKILNLIEEATKQDHGTVVIITPEAASEAERLSRQSTVLEPIELNTSTMKAVTGIDGAVLLGVDGKCYAIGVILDGTAISRGDPARGARYNSVLRYMSSRNHIAFGVIVSEDGSVDAIPNLRPAIRRSEIDCWIADLESISKLEQIPNRYVSHRRWFGQHRFYLTQADCDRLNELFESLEVAWREQGSSQVHFVLETLKPDSAMREDWYYLPEPTDQN